MEVTYHPLVQRDVVEALRYYHHISPRLAEEFHSELRLMIARAAEQPMRFHPAGYDLRRANLRRFPYHILYDVRADSIRVMVVRHNKRHPDYGTNRE